MKLRFKEKYPQAEDIVSFVFEPEEPMEWQAGQFITYILPHEHPDTKGFKRWFTIAAAPGEKYPVITTHMTDSSFKQALNAMKPGDTVETSGVKGDFIWQESERPIVMVAGGIGMTPFYAMLKDRAIRSEPLAATLIYSNHDENVLYKEELDAWAAEHPELKIEYITAERVTPTRLAELIPDLNRALIYVSGPEAMVETLGDALKESGLPETQLKQDFFPGYSELLY